MNENYDWDTRLKSMAKDAKRERMGMFYLVLSITAIIEGIALLLYGIFANHMVVASIVIPSFTLVVCGLAIAIGGFGKVGL